MSELSKYFVAVDGEIELPDRKYFVGFHLSSTDDEAGATATITDGVDGSVVFSMNVEAGAHGEIFPSDKVQFPNGIYVTVSGDAYATLLVA